MGYLPEERGLYPKMKVGEQLQFLAELKGLKPRQAKTRSEEWLERFEMTAVIEKKVEELSKGNQQKIQFIATIQHGPKLIILDEPFSGLDPLNVKLVKEVIQELKNSGRCVIFSTHQMEQVEMLCDAICLIDKGENVLEGELQEVKKPFGKNSVILELEGDDGFLQQLDYVQKVEQFENHIEVHLSDASRSQELLQAAVDKLNIKRFELVEPTLNDIFIETVDNR